MICSIHQPCYFPWLGLLSKIAGSDTLILLDEVQLSDSAFQHRNQFLTLDGKVKYLTIPFVKQNYLNLPLKDIKIADPGWGVIHNNFLTNNYKKHPFFDQIYPEIAPLFSTPTTYLIEVILKSMDISMALLGIKTKIIMQHQLQYQHEAKKADLILQLLQATQATSYLSGTGAKIYQDDALFDSAGISISYNEFSHPIYPQKNTQQFISGLSCLDLLFNVGSVAASTMLARESSP
ncbi:WbqC family protein [Solimicrobium silvestre]|uniref:WbqC-like protein family n=1 Tax=Solimicrobium silvestre TaxID=2099400 RepID=A0A2S9GUV2_9BURK|nr:WbqC family protein [Solimicrobium silvestre]PRC91478.1 WbqC-like protein family [Solimicrobium silvestre]